MTELPEFQERSGLAVRPWGGGQAARRLRLALAMGVALGAISFAFTAAGDNDYMTSGQKYFEEGQYSAALIEAKNAVRAAPNDPEPRILLGKIYLSLGDADGAETAFLRARELGASGDELELMLAYARLGKGSFQEVLGQPVNQTGQLSAVQRDLTAARGDALLALQKLDEAEEAYDRVLASSPHAMALRGKAVIALTRNQPEKSRELLDQALAAAPDNDEIVSADAEWYMRQGKFDQARDRFAKAVSLNPIKLIPRIGHVRALLGAGDVKAAVADMAELRKLQPNNPMVVFQDSVVQLAAGNYEAAKSAADQVLAVDQYNPLAMSVSGNSAYALGLYEQAIARLTNYIQVVPKDDQARIVLAASHLRMKNAAAAKATLQPLLSREPQETRVLALMGVAEALSGNSKAAADYLEKASALSPEDKALRSQLGMVQIAAGDPAKGVAELRQVLELSPAEDQNGQIDAREITLIVGQLKTGDFAAALENVERLKKDHPDNVRLVVLAGIAHMGRQEVEPAKAAFARAAELDPRSVDARLNLAQLQASEGQLDAAKTLLQEVLTQHPDNYAAMLALASIAQRSGNAAEQAKWLEQVVTAQPNLPGPRLQLALFYLGHQQPGNALETAQVGLEQDSDSIEFLGVAGQAQLQLGQAEQAITTFERLVKRAPKTVESHFLLARAYALAGRHEQMQSELKRALELDPNHLPSQVALVRFLALDGQQEEAKKRLQALKVANPDDPDVLAQEGWLLLHERRPEEALKPLQAAFDHSGPAVSRDVVETLALAHWEARQWDKSLAVREGWLRNNPSDISMLLALGQGYTQINRLDAATATYQRVHALMPDNVVALNNLAWLLQVSAPDEALGYAERANQLAPGTASILDTLGWLVLQKGDAARAVTLFEEAAQKVPSNPQYQYHLAQALGRAGDKDRAKDVLQKLLADKRLEAEHPKIRAMLERIGN